MANPLQYARLFNGHIKEDLSLLPWSYIIFIREHASVDVDFANFDRDPTYMPTILERYNKYVVSQHVSDGSTSESSFVTMDTFRNNMATSIALA